ncbi:MAG: hypothetical protein WC852_04365 [Candidatus Nanoarchaeia archaeon]|jgi:hypothetical protein
MACYGNCKKTRAMKTAVDQYHKWDDMVFKGMDGVPPLVNVEMSAYTMDFFMRETELLRLLFTSEPKNFERTNTNMATVLYDRDKLVGIAIEYGNNDRAFIAMEQLDKSKFLGLADWQAEPEKHAAMMRARIEECTGRYIGLIKCADLNGFFGGLHRVIENENTLEMLLEGVKFAANCVTYGHLSIQPEPKFFSYMRMLNKLTDKMDAKSVAEKINGHLPDFEIGLVLQNREKQYAGVEIYSEKGNLQFQDFGAPNLLTAMSLKEVTKAINREAEETLTIGLSTDFLYNAMKAALTYSPLKLGKAVFNAARKGELVVC